MLGNVFKAYDIRGIYPDPLNDRMAWQIGYGASKFLLSEAKSHGHTTPMMKRLVVGRDMRASSPRLSKRLQDGVADQGGNVIDVGLVDTPFVTFAINHLDCAGGVMVTASHNPPQYNGFKISKRRARPVGSDTGLNDIRKFAAMADPRKDAAAPGAKGLVESRDLWGAYRDHVRAFLDLGGKKLRVVLDASNAMAGTMVPRVFGPKGADTPGLTIVEMNFENSKGVFAHEPNPLVAANLADLRARVVAEKADLGLCFDGDADRCMLIDEKGAVVGCDHLTAFLARHFLADTPGASIVYDLRSSRALAEEVAKAGGVPLRSRVGHVFIKAAMAEHDAVFGGELSGHFYFRDNFFADSGAIAMAVVLSAVARSGRPVSESIKPIARFPQSGEINFEPEDKDAALEDLEAEFEGRAAFDRLDGVTIDCWTKEGWWCNVRRSNTEPLLRLNLEAKSRKKLDEMLAAISPMLGRRVAH